MITLPNTQPTTMRTASIAILLLATLLLSTTKVLAQYKCEPSFITDYIASNVRSEITSIVGTPDGQILIGVGFKFYYRDTINNANVGTTQYIIRSTDAGKTWKEVQFPNEIVDTISPKLADVSFIKDENTLIAVGSGSRYFFKSIDKGLTWTKVRTPDDFFWEDICVSPTNPNNAIVWGGYVRFVTSDGGDTWKPLFKNPDNDLLSIFSSSYAGASSIQLAMNNKDFTDLLFYHSTDNGNTWENIPFQDSTLFPPGSFIRGVYSKGDTSIMVFTLKDMRTLYRETFDGGKKYSDRVIASKNDFSSPMSPIFLDAQTILASIVQTYGLNNITLNLSTDAGVTWTLSNFPYESYRITTRYQRTILNNGDMYIYGSGISDVSTSTAKIGNTVLKIHSSPDSALQACAFSIYPDKRNSPKEGIHSIGWSTSNGASHYNLKISQHNGNYLKKNFDNKIVLDTILTDTSITFPFNVGRYHMLLRPIDSINTYKKGYWTLGTINFVKDTISSVTNDYINIWNFGSSPNPTSGECTVNMVVNPDVAKSTTLKLYSTLGREVLDATSAIEIKPDATATARISLAGLPDGLYLCVLNDGKRTDTKNILLIK